MSLCIFYPIIILDWITLISIHLGIPVRSLVCENPHTLMHHKYCVIDVFEGETKFKENLHPSNGLVMSGSMNWTMSVSYFFFVDFSAKFTKFMFDYSRHFVEIGKIFSLLLIRRLKMDINGNLIQCGTILDNNSQTEHQIEDKYLRDFFCYNFFCYH